LSVDPRRTRSPRNPAAAAETELIAEAATLVIRQAALAEPGNHVAPERPVTLRLPRSGSYRDWPFRCSLNGRTQVTSASAESQDPHFNWITAPGPAERKTASFRDPDGPVAVTQQSSARYHHCPGVRAAAS
jgi:hypothetical protein